MSNSASCWKSRAGSRTVPFTRSRDSGVFMGAKYTAERSGNQIGGGWRRKTGISRGCTRMDADVLGCEGIGQREESWIEESGGNFFVPRLVERSRGARRCD